jgi:hypothetical protein
MRTVDTLFKAVSQAGVRTPSSPVQKEIFFGRVLDIILDETHKDYLQRGGLKALNGVYYAEITTTSPTSQENRVNFAYQSNSHIQDVPKVGELVKLEVQPANSVEIVDQLLEVYYTGIVNIWNHPKDNLALDVRKPLDINTALQEEFDPDLIYNPVRSAQGDLHFRGRQGQSLRFTGSKSRTNFFVEDSNKDKPVIILRTGGTSLNVPYETVQESINKDISSIYFTSDHVIPLQTVRPFNKSYKKAPIQAADKYRGEQILVNTGRVVLNAKNDSILLSAKEAIAFSSLTLNIETKDYIAVESSKIYIGKGALDANRPEPVLLGNKTERLLQGILNTLSSLAADLAVAQTLDGVPVPVLNKRGAQLRPLISELEKQLLDIKSKKIFVE